MKKKVKVLEQLYNGEIDPRENYQPYKIIPLLLKQQKIIPCKVSIAVKETSETI